MVAGLSYSVSAQSQQTALKLSVGPEFALPVGDLSDVYNLGLGASIQGELNVAKSLNLTASAGYLSFGYKKEFKDLLEAIGLEAKRDGGIPVKAGAKYYFGEIFYGAAEVGAAFSTTKGGKTAFAYAPGIGGAFKVSDKSSIDLGVRYESWSRSGGTSSFLGLRVAYAFGI